MRIDVLSDTRMPTLPHGGHGLGRLAYDIADGLAKRGHTVCLLAGPGSQYPPDVALISESSDETERAKSSIWLTDCVHIDLSHFHDLSRLHPELPVLNWVVDVECAYKPPRAIVGNEWQRRNFPSAKIVPLGVNVDAIPFRSTPTRNELVFCHKIVPHKGFDTALDVANRVKKPIRFAGENMVHATLPNYVGEINNDLVLYEFLGNAQALLSPCREDSGGRVNLEAAACGTPVLCLDITGTMCHVEHCVSGFVCGSAEEMAEAVGDLPLLDRAKCREWVADTHSTKRMIDGLEELAQKALAGESW